MAGNIYLWFHSSSIENHENELKGFESLKNLYSKKLIQHWRRQKAQLTHTFFAALFSVKLDEPMEETFIKCR